MGRQQHLNYHGMRYVRHHVARLIPKGKSYVEPFAGHCWVAREVCKGERKCLVGDVNSEALSWCLNYHKISAEGKVQDWKETVKQAPKGSIFLFDPPFVVGRGTPGNLRPGRFGDKDYYPEIVSFCRKHQCVINVNPQHEKDVCSIFKCREFNVEHGKKNWRYVVAYNF
jgi:site-specific DNA-adenine methylase